MALNPTTPPELIEWALPYLDYINVMSVNPGFGGQDFIPEMVDKVRRLKQMTDVPIEVDGGITAETAPLMVEAGAQILIAGSAVFKGDPATEMRKIIEAAAASHAYRHQATGNKLQATATGQLLSYQAPSRSIRTAAHVRFPQPLTVDSRESGEATTRPTAPAAKPEA